MIIVLLTVALGMFDTFQLLALFKQTYMLHHTQNFHSTPHQPMGKMQKFQPGAVKFKFEPVKRKITGLCKMLRIKAPPVYPSASLS